MVSSSDMRIALVAATWHKEIVECAVESCCSELAVLGVRAKDKVELFEVPGSLEIPFTSMQLARMHTWDAIIGFGLVVDGGIYRHEFVAQSVIDGLVRVGIETGVPVLSSVLTPQMFDEKDAAQSDFFKEHMVLKGKEVAQAAVKMIRMCQIVEIAQ